MIDFTYNELVNMGITNQHLKNDIERLSKLYTSIQTKKAGLKKLITKIEEVEDLSETDRGIGGFGSTGSK